MTTELNGQWEIDGFRIGRGTIYPVDSAMGLGVVDVKAVDLDRASGRGSYLGTDREATREIILAIGIDGDPDTEAYGDAVTALTGAWKAQGASTSILSFQRFGRRRRVYGRPRGLILPWDDDFHLGAAKGAARFFCGDPIVYDDDETTVTNSGTFTVTNEGDETVWPVVTVTGPGGTVTLRNNTDDGAEVVLTGLGGTASVDFDRKTVTVGSTDAYGTTSSNARWWGLLPGANSITATGATSVTIAFRSGWASG